MPNQIRLTVRGPRCGPQQAGAECCDVLVTAPPGTVLAAVAGGLATALASVTGTPAAPGDPVPVYFGPRRLDPQRQMVGEPPLVDGAVISLHGPSEQPATPLPDGVRLDVVAGPDSGGVHLLHGGHVRIGRSADADVVLDDPDVSRLHCTVTVAGTGAVTVTDLDSTNGTTVDGVPVLGRPLPLRPGAALRVGETLLRLHAGPAALADASGAAAGGPGGPGIGSGGGTGGGPGSEAAVPAARVGSAATQRNSPPGGTARRPTPLRGTAAPFVPQQPAAAPPPPQSQPPQSPPRQRAAPVARPEGAEHIEHGRAPAPPASGGTHGAGFVRPPVGPAASAAEERRRGIGGWARRLGGGRRAEAPAPEPPGRTIHPAEPAPGFTGPPADADPPGRWPDSAEVLLTALGPGPRLWERGADHPDALAVRLGTAHHTSRPDVPVTVSLREAGSLGLAGPRERLLPLVRSALAQLAALHPPSTLEIVLVASGRCGRAEDWSWLGWLPHTRPSHGQDCRLLFGFDRDQAAARTEELVRRVDEGPLGAGWVTAERAEIAAAAARHRGPSTVLVVDGDPGTAALRETVARLAGGGSVVGVHVLCLADAPAATPSSPLSDTLATAYAASPAFRECGTAALLSGAVGTAVRVVARGGEPAGGVATVDGVSAAWAQRFARALAPVREPEPATGAVPAARVPAALPPSSRLLEELGLARATPAALLARWSAVPDRSGGSAALVFGAGPRGPLTADLATDRSHLLVSGAPGSGKTELLCSLAAALAAGDRPDRLGLVLVDGDGDGLRVCAELPHAVRYLSAGEPVGMREFAQSLSREVKRRSELLGQAHYEAFVQGTAAAVPAGTAGPDSDRGTVRLRARSAPGGAAKVAANALPRLVVLVDDFDVLVDPALGNPGRPAAGSVVRALEAVAREGVRLGVHLIAATGRPDRTAQTAADQAATMRVALGSDPASEEPKPGRGVLHRPDGSVTPFQGGRVTGRIPRTATLRPTVVPLDWARAGDPPSRRPVRELGNGPTDLALLASATERAARESGATPVAPPV
ncbi:FHA domain-containing protein [Streptomyces sp. 549]|uniref:FHA domain-containing protein n=1 Tax=Streptomyces sp. 549 TaxID=3049076 RepID=UPI0024C2858A|nr:FHA domain-containing protein [Streptomyces sp. 549]MDK1473873.1 FHA domain-containing protein [Streptomyces sp. 549]